ncbi:membrane-associated kinase regulator [Thalictrum thalictroides]|nr:membrane-associated kinase regulator [Thalictrum thalictroides]
MSDLLSIKPEKSVKVKKDLSSTSSSKKDNNNGIFSNSFSGNLRYPRRKSSVLSCPSSMRSSPNHSGVLCRNTAISGGNGANNVPRSVSSSGTSSMEELQNAIQGAIAHCKNSMVQNNNLVSNEI